MQAFFVLRGVNRKSKRGVAPNPRGATAIDAWRERKGRTMDTQQTLQYWAIWYPKAGATGILIGRGLIGPTDELLFHAAGEVITVEVTDAAGNRLAYGKDLRQTNSTPMCRLRREGDRIFREDIWPTEEDLGLLVFLPGGEVGTLKAWWNSEDQKEWRWQAEFYNTIR